MSLFNLLNYLENKREGEDWGLIAKIKQEAKQAKDNAGTALCTTEEIHFRELT